MNPISTSRPASSHSSRAAAFVAAALLLVPSLLAGRATAEDLPIVTGDKASVTGGITPVGDVDAFRLDLFAGDKVTVKVKDAGPRRGLLSTLALSGPGGDPIAVTIAKQGTRKPSLSYTATESGVHAVAVSGDPGGFGGAEGNYTISTKIKRVKARKTQLAAPGGGEFVIPVQISDGGLLTVKLVAKKGGFDLSGLFRPDGRPEPGFLAALKIKGRTRAKGKKIRVTGGFGTYELRGSYDAGATLKAVVKVRAGASAKSRRIADDEPRFDPFLAPFPSSGIGGTLVTAIGQNLTFGSGGSPSQTGLVFDDAAGGAFVARIGIVADSLLHVTIASTAGGFDVDGLFGPGGREDARFPGFLETTGRTAAATEPAAPYKVTRGTGYYELRGQYDAGARVTLDIEVVRGDGANADRLPRVWVGSLEVHPRVIENPFDQVLRFPVPADLAPDATYDISIRNADGQGMIAKDAFFFVPPPTITSLTAVEAGPAGGRAFRLLGSNFRPDALVLFDDTVVQPSFVLSNRIDVVAPPHAPGTVFPRVRDGLGQMATSPVAFTYLDIGSNTIASTAPTALQGVGGETVTVTGIDFGADSVLTLDGRPLGATRVSDTQMTFVAPAHGGGTYDLRVADAYQQSSTLAIDIRAFSDVSASAIPAPKTGTGVVDGWRASRVLSGDLTGDGITDLVLLRAAIASGVDVDRPRLRILAGDGAGAYTDASDGVPAVSATDDWRARDGALTDVDEDGDLDVLLLTGDTLSGGRSSLRLLLNDGDGNLTDVTATTMPGATTAGDHNQGLSLVVADVDGVNGADVVIIHDTFFEETIDESPPLGNPPPEPPPPPVLVTYYFAGTRVLLNDGNGTFSRSLAALPAVDADSVQRFEGKAIAAANIDGNPGIDLILTDDDVREDPDSPGTYLRRAVLLTNDGNGAFTDDSATWLPAGSGAEYLQGDHVAFVDFDDSGDADLAVWSDTRLVTPGTSTRADMPALRLFENTGSAFTAVAAGMLPAADGDDSLQSRSIAFGDLTGDGRSDMVLVAARAPNAGAHGARVLVWDGEKFARGERGLPNPLLADDGRGRDVLLLDVDDDGDLDVVIVRDESDQTVRNTRVLRNPRVE